MVMLGLALVETIPQGTFEVKQAYNILCGFELITGQHHWKNIWKLKGLLRAHWDYGLLSMEC